MNIRRVKYFLIVFLILLASTAQAKIGWRSATSLIGGGTGALDRIDGISLQDGDIAIVSTTSGTYFYVLDADSGATEDGITVISPDSNASDKRWVLNSKNFINANALGDIATTVAAISTTEGQMIVDSDITLTANLTIPSTLTLKIVHGGSIDGAYTLTVNGPFEGCPGCFGSSLTVAFGTGSIKEALPEWWYSGTDSTLLAAAINSALTSYKNVLLTKISYPLADPIIMSRGMNLRGIGKDIVFLRPEAGVDAIQVISDGSEVRWWSISDLAINANDTGARGIHISGGGVCSHSRIENVRIYDPTAECIYVEDTDWQENTIKDVRTEGGTYGLRVTGDSSSNVNTYINLMTVLATTAGTSFDMSGATYHAAEGTFIGCNFESNEKVGLELICVSDFTFTGCHFEDNGTNVADGPYPHVVIKGDATHETRNITFIGSQMSGDGANQGDLNIQVQSDDVYGPISIINCYLTGKIDLGDYSTYLNIIGKHPSLGVIGNNEAGYQDNTNVIHNGSFENFNEGETEFPTHWLVRSGATAAVGTGYRGGNSVEVTCASNGDGIKQYIYTLKPNTKYSIHFKEKVTTLTATGVQFSLVTDVATHDLGSLSTTNSDWAHYEKFFTTGAIASSYFQAYQIGAGALVFELDDFVITEGHHVESYQPSVYDSNLNAGTVTLATSAATTTVTDARIRSTSIIVFSPTTANAGAEIASGNMYVSAKTEATSFVITHTNSATTGRTFGYVILN